MKPVLTIAGLSALFVAAVYLMLTLFVGNPFANAPQNALRPNDAQTVALGAQVYTRHCAACHGAQLQGQANWQQRDDQGRLPAPPHDASGHTWHHADEVLFRITKYGVAKSAGLGAYVSSMPIYEGVLSDQEIVAVLSWIKAQWPADIRAKHDGMNRAALKQR